MKKQFKKMLFSKGMNGGVAVTACCWSQGCLFLCLVEPLYLRLWQMPVILSLSRPKTRLTRKN